MELKFSKYRKLSSQSNWDLIHDGFSDISCTEIEKNLYDKKRIRLCVIETSEIKTLIKRNIVNSPRRPFGKLNNLSNLLPEVLE